MTNIERFGFRTGRSGAHQARSMMLAELQCLLDANPDGGKPDVFEDAICRENLLAKPTASSRALSFGHLKSLYALDDSFVVFRQLRRLWKLETSAQAQLALCCSLARDPLLRESWDFIKEQVQAVPVSTVQVSDWLEAMHPKRWSLATRNSMAGNLNGTWTLAGFLTGKTNKHRSHKDWASVAITYSLFLGWLEGLRGEALLQSFWADLWEVPLENRHDLVAMAARKGLLEMRSAGGILEIRFDGWLHQHEERWLI